jgi:hypothetical protein
LETVQVNFEALSFSGRPHGRERIEALQLTNEQVAKRIVGIYEEILQEK